MCIIAVQPTGKTIKKEHFKNSFNNNTDGWGMMWVEKNRLNIIKDVSTNWEEPYEKYSEINRNVQSPIVLHFRIRTHGPVSKELCHPFLIRPGLAFAHNGIIKIETNDKESDTMAFNRLVLQKLPNDFLKKEKKLEYIKNEIGKYNKMAFLDVNKKLTIINHEAGEFYNGIWFSNDGFKYRHRYGYYHDTEWDWNDVYSSRSYNYGKYCRPNYINNYNRKNGEGNCKYCGGLLRTADEFLTGICDLCFIDDIYSKNHLMGRSNVYG